MADLKVTSKGGERVYDDRPGNPGKNVTLVGAMSDEGLIADMTLPGGLNTPSFLVYLKKILLPQLWVFAIVAIDNLLIHHAEAVESLIHAVGAKVKFLPPYPPDLFRVEFCWSKIKVIVRSEAARTSNVLDEAITKAINAINNDENALN
ncbi:transposase [Microcoleus vaginatus GB1-A2]|uniref:transposase n=1 Tax=Microcoleus vaginatus TaxID=119532 RepID=UPI0016896DFB|nr:transposase [Microcoleus sp. FACHB-61]